MIRNFLKKVADFAVLVPEVLPVLPDDPDSAPPPAVLHDVQATHEFTDSIIIEAESNDDSIARSGIGAGDNIQSTIQKDSGSGLILDITDNIVDSHFDIIHKEVKNSQEGDDRERKKRRKERKAEKKSDKDGSKDDLSTCSELVISLKDCIEKYSDMTVLTRKGNFNEMFSLEIARVDYLVFKPLVKIIRRNICDAKYSKRLRKDLNKATDYMRDILFSFRSITALGFTYCVDGKKEKSNEESFCRHFNYLRNFMCDTVDVDYTEVSTEELDEDIKSRKLAKRERKRLRKEQEEQERWENQFSGKTIGDGYDDPNDSDYVNSGDEIAPIVVTKCKTKRAEKRQRTAIGDKDKETQAAIVETEAGSTPSLQAAAAAPSRAVSSADVETDTDNDDGNNNSSSVIPPIDVCTDVTTKEKVTTKESSKSTSIRISRWKEEEDKLLIALILSHIYSSKVAVCEMFMEQRPLWCERTVKKHFLEVAYRDRLHGDPQERWCIKASYARLAAALLSPDPSPASIHPAAPAHMHYYLPDPNPSPGPAQQGICVPSGSAAIPDPYYAHAHPVHPFMHALSQSNSAILSTPFAKQAAAPPSYATSSSSAITMTSTRSVTQQSAPSPHVPLTAGGTRYTDRGGGRDKGDGGVVGNFSNGEGSDSYRDRGRRDSGDRSRDRHYRDRERSRSRERECDRGHRRDTYRHDTYRRDTYRHDTYRHDTYRHDTYRDGDRGSRSIISGGAPVGSASSRGSTMPARSEAGVGQPGSGSGSSRSAGASSGSGIRAIHRDELIFIDDIARDFGGAYSSRSNDYSNTSSTEVVIDLIRDSRPEHGTNTAINSVASSSSRSNNSSSNNNNKQATKPKFTPRLPAAPSASTVGRAGTQALVAVDANDMPMPRSSKINYDAFRAAMSQKGTVPACSGSTKDRSGASVDASERAQGLNSFLNRNV